MDSTRDAKVEEVQDPYVGMLVVGNLIEDVENNMGLYDWEEEDERKEDKLYKPHIDSVTVSSHLTGRFSGPDFRSFFSTYLVAPNSLYFQLPYRYFLSILRQPPPYTTLTLPPNSLRETTSKATSTTIALAVPPARTLRDR
jgi:hypothetical protein